MKQFSSVTVRGENGSTKKRAETKGTFGYRPKLAMTNFGLP
jgi:hypothetical protein